MLYIILTCLAFFMAYMIYKLIINPYVQILYYKKQGGVPLFFWSIIPYLKNVQNSSKHGNFYHTYNETAKQHPQAKFLVENYGPDPHLALLDPEMVKEMLRNYEVYHKDLRIFTVFLEAVHGTTIFAEDQKWKKGRRLISGAFTYEVFKDLVPMIVETAQEHFNDWIKNEDLSKLNMLDKLNNIAGDVVGKFFFGRRFGEKKPQEMPMTKLAQKMGLDLIAEFVHPLTFIFGTSLLKMNVLPRHKKLNKTIAEFRSRCKRMMDEADQSELQENNLAKILLKMRTSGLEEDRLSDELIVGEFAGMFGAGTDSTSHMVNSAMYFLWKYPHVLQKVQEEVNNEFGDINNLDLEKINRMSYTLAMLKETLRMGGPVGQLFTRMAQKDTDLCGVKVKKGTLLNVYHTTFFLNPKYFIRPDEFIPERWLPNSPLVPDDLKTEPYAFIPFSAGPRNCLGQHLAMIEARIIIGIFLKTFKFSFPEDYNFKLTVRFSFEPLDPLIAKLTPIINQNNT